MTRIRWVLAMVAVFAATASVLAAPSATAQESTAQAAADEIVIDLDFTVVSTDFTPFEELNFEARCDGLDEPQQLSIALEELRPTAPNSFVLVKDAALTTCDIELL